MTEIEEPDPQFTLHFNDTLSKDEIAIEELCEFERYLELNTDVHELAIERGELNRWFYYFYYVHLSGDVNIF